MLGKRRPCRNTSLAIEIRVGKRKARMAGDVKFVIVEYARFYLAACFYDRIFFFQKMNGAACMFYPGVLEDFGKKLGRDFYLLPSSVHEVILVPADETVSKEALWEIVTDINRTQVAEEEILADSVYYYDRKKDRILWIL